MFHVVFYHPEIPGNTGNAMRLAAGTGCTLHLIEPLGFSVDDAKLRRAGMDYRERATLHVHPDLDSAWGLLKPDRIIAFSASAEASYASIDYRPGEVLLFGPESVGLPAEILEAERTTAVRIPMLPGNRSLNLANSAAIAVYEAWRQQEFSMPCVPGGSRAR